MFRVAMGLLVPGPDSAGRNLGNTDRSTVSGHAGGEPEQRGPPRLLGDASLLAVLTAQEHSVGSDHGEAGPGPERRDERLHGRLVLVREGQRANGVAVSDLRQLRAVAPDGLPPG